MKCLGLHNKPTAEVHPGHMLTGPKEEHKPSVVTRHTFLTPFNTDLISEEVHHSERASSFMS
jgi:hypothetical protein